MVQHTKHVKFCQVIVSERAGTVDIIRYLLSYTYSSSESYSEGKELIDSAVRNIMAELVSFTGLSQSSSFAESNPKQSSLSQHERFLRPPVQNIEMKRGDWICTRYANSTFYFFCTIGFFLQPATSLTLAFFFFLICFFSSTQFKLKCSTTFRCSFMNFARNVRCLECNEQRPKKLLTGGEWECPQ